MDADADFGWLRHIPSNNVVVLYSVLLSCFSDAVLNWANSAFHPFEVDK